MVVAEQEIEDARTLTRVLGEVSARELERIGRSMETGRAARTYNVDEMYDGDG